MTETKLVPLELSEEQAQKVGKSRLNEICEKHGWKISDYPIDMANTLINTYASEAKKRYSESLAMLNL